MNDVVGISGWAVVELFGHKRVAGRVSEQAMGGASLLRIDVPAIGDEPAATVFYGAAAIYGITLVTEEVARVAARSARPEPVTVWELTAGRRLEIEREVERLRKGLLGPGRVDVHDDDDDDDDDDGGDEAL